MGFHNANAIVDHMMECLQIDEDKRTATATQYATEVAFANQVNAMMESQMQTLLAQVQALQLAKTHNHGSSYGRGRGRGRAAGRVRGCAQLSDLPTLKYCWTHDNCGHGSKEYTHPSDREKKEASFAHMMSGRTNRCYNITE